MASDPPTWVRDAIVYQIFPDRFAVSARVRKPGRLEPWDAPSTRHGFKGGDLLGIVEHLDHIEALGATAISLNPIFASAANHRYHTYDYTSVDPILGGNAALRELLDAAHARGMRVILDGVFNHASRGFWPFNHVMENGLASPYVDWFHVNRAWLASGRQLRAYDEQAIPGAVEADWAESHAAGVESLDTLGYRAWWDLPALPKLNTDNPEVRDFLLGVAEDWIRFGADGWRLDVAQEIRTPGFWAAFRERVRAANPDAYILAEVWEERPDLLDGTTYDALMSYPFLSAVVGFVAGDHFDRRVVAQHGWLERSVRPLDGPGLAAALAGLDSAYRRPVRDAMLNLVDGHDTPRLRSMAGGDVAAVRLATLLQMTFPGAPCIYYGDEIGLQGEMDPDCRGAFPWSEAAWDHDLLAYCRAAIALRRANPVLRTGSFQVVAAEGPALAYLRDRWDEHPSGQPGDAFLVALNNGTAPAVVRCALSGLAGRTLLPERLDPAATVDPVLVDERGELILEVPARSGLVLRAR